MPVNDLIYFAAFLIFLAGAGMALRGYHPVRALWIMSMGMGIDFFATVMPGTGVKSLAIVIGSNRAILSAMTLGVLVWMLFLAAVFVRLMGKHSLFCVMITVVKVAWFVDLLFFMSGVYNP